MAHFEGRPVHLILSYDKQAPWSNGLRLPVTREGSGINLLREGGEGGDVYIFKSSYSVIFIFYLNECSF